MDDYSLIASLVASLAWPTVAVGALLVLRGPIRDLAAVLGRIKYGDFEAEFGRRLEVVDALREDLEQTADRPAFSRARHIPGQSGGQLQSFGGDPQAAILSAWARVERAARNVAARIGLPDAQARTPLGVVRALDSTHALPPEVLELFNELRALRNEAAHAQAFRLSQERVLQFVAAADFLTRALETGADIYLRDRAEEAAGK